MFSFKKSLDIPGQGRGAAGPADADPDRRAAFRQRQPAEGSLSGGLETAIFGMGCFWGAERKFWELGDGIYATAVGYAGGQRRIRPTRRSAPAAPATTRWCWWSTTRTRCPSTSS